MDYSIVVLNIAPLLGWFNSLFPVVNETYKIRPEEKEKLFDWLVLCALKDSIQVTYQNHLEFYPHDLYSIIYQSFGSGMVFRDMFKDLIEQHRLEFLKGQRIKAMVLSNSLILARGSHLNVIHS